ncbi:MAG: iron dependent repressor, metal binding and dimerization domain protein [Methanobacteriaceae archaeon]
MNNYGNEKLSENREEYLEALYKYGSKDDFVSTNKLSSSLNISPASVTEMLKKLDKLGYVEYVPYKGAKLSIKGFRIAKTIIRKHRILELFLSDVLKINEEKVHFQACEMEHSLSGDAEMALCKILNNPDSCPDNRLIPECNFDFSSCGECESISNNIELIPIRKKTLISLYQLHECEKGIVLFLRGNNDFVKRLSSEGIEIGTLIRVNSIDKNNNLLNLDLGYSKLNLGISDAKNIFIDLIDDSNDTDNDDNGIDN